MVVLEITRILARINKIEPWICQVQKWLSMNYTEGRNWTLLRLDLQG